MKYRNYMIYEVLCVIALFAFIIWVCATHKGGTKKSVDEIASPVCQAIAQDQMEKKTNMDASKAFGFDIDKTDGIVYYANDNVMDVSEMLIVKLADANDAEEFKAAIENRVSDRENLYKNYAPEQYALLEDSIIRTDGNIVFYCTAVNSDELYEAYKKAL